MLHEDKQAGTYEITNVFYLIAISTTSLSLELLLKDIVSTVVLRRSLLPHDHEAF